MHHHTRARRPKAARLAALASIAITALLPTLPSHGSDPLPPLSDAPTLFRNVNVLTMTEPGVKPGWSVLVVAGRISQVGPIDAVNPGDALQNLTIIEGDGNAWLIPGLADMHVHLPPYEPGNAQQEAAAFRACALLLANGITTARGMVGHPSHPRLRQAIADGSLLGPTLHIAGPPIHQGIAKTPEEAQAAVRLHSETGFDFIKSHRVVQEEVYRALQTTAGELGIPVTGHVDNEVGITVAMEYPQQQEHLDAIPAALIANPAAASQFGQIPPAPVLDAIDTTLLPELAKKLAAAGIWSVPTLSLFETILDQKSPTAELMARPEMRYIVPQAVGQWAEQRNATKFPALWGVDYGERVAALRKQITLALADAGVGLMAGSDSPQFFKVVGFSLHDELASLAACGLGAERALACATSNPARYMDSLPNRGSATGVPPDFGSIAPGKRADLVLLDADPTVDIRSTRRIQAVMLRGRLIQRAELDALLAEVERSARPPFNQEPPLKSDL